MKMSPRPRFPDEVRIDTGGGEVGAAEAVPVRIVRRPIAKAVARTMERRDASWFIAWFPLLSVT